MVKGEVFYLDNTLCSADQWNEGLETGTVVYEVLRIVDGVPLFYFDHYKRLMNSCQLVGKKGQLDRDQLFTSMVTLAAENKFRIGNVMLKLIFSQSAGLPDENPRSLLYFIPHSYPSDQQYITGVDVGILEAERQNPEAKVEQGVRNIANKILTESTLFEVLLVDREGYITEGSKSNMVFVKNEVLYTCPLSKVLSGITLLKVIEIAEKENIPLKFEAVPLEKLHGFDALFITGTSPKILPVRRVGEIQFDVTNPLMRFLMEEYNHLLQLDISKRS
jgi:branched-chain amino acid aminotransferase